jgi:hypothetical protein
MPVDPTAVAKASIDAAANASPAPDARRRRLLAGAVGVLPSVYTLASGAQVAASSQMACWATEPQATPIRFSSDSDSWLRSTVYGGDYDGHQAYCVTSPQNSCIDPLHPGKGGDGSAWIFNRARTTAGMGGPSAYDVRFVVGQGNQVTNVGSAPSAQGLVYVDRNATLATLDPNGKSFLHPVTASCWTSMLGGRTTPLG